MNKDIKDAVQQIIDDIQYVFNCSTEVAEKTAVNMIKYPRLLTQLNELIEQKKQLNNKVGIQS
jgi:hypothetical protein